MKIRRKHGDTWYEETARANTHAKCLGEQNLPVARAQAEHEVAEDDEKAADEQQLPEVARIVGWPR